MTQCAVTLGWPCNLQKGEIAVSNAASKWSIKAFVASGGRLRPKAQRLEWQRICRACPFWNGITCGGCGCLKLKTWAASEVVRTIRQDGGNMSRKHLAKMAELDWGGHPPQTHGIWPGMRSWAAD